MRKLFSLLAVAVAFSGLALLKAAEEKTVTGMAQCAKCSLKEKKSCQSVIVVKEGDKNVKYYLVGDVAKKDHKDKGFCTAPKAGGPTVKATGDVEEKNGKMVMTPSKIEAVE